MYKKIATAAFVGSFGLATAAFADPAQTNNVTAQLKVDFTYPEDKANVLLAPSPETMINYTLASPQRAVVAYQVKMAPLTNVKDMAARPPFWGPVDIIVIGMAGMAAIFMRLLLIRQRKPRFAGGISVETIN